MSSMDRDLVIWTGPVNLMQVPGATVPGDPVEIALPCTGDGSSPPKCSTMAEGFMGPTGMLDAMAARAGVTLDRVNDVFLGAFSAGGGVIRRIMASPTDRRRIRAVMLSDATYSSEWADKRNRIPVVPQEWVTWGSEVATGDGSQLWVATASPSPNFQWATGVEVLREIRRQIEEKTGRTFERLPSFYDVDPQPDAVYKLGTVVFAEYPMQPLGHGHPKIAPQVWQQALWPWLEQLRGKEPPGPQPPVPPVPPVPPTPPGEPSIPGWLGNALAVVVGAAIGYLGVRLVVRKS